MGDWHHVSHSDGNDDLGEIYSVRNDIFNFRDNFILCLIFINYSYYYFCNILLLLDILSNSSLWGNQYVTGGAGEGEERLQPLGTMQSHHRLVKTDASLPAYCKPPNPCPVGYTGKYNLMILEMVLNKKPSYRMQS